MADGERKYRLGRDFRDSGASSDPEDEFLRWINIPGSGIRNMGGIRPLKFTQLSFPLHAYIVLVTHEKSRGSVSNPWEDLVDLSHGRIVYWGDAKFHDSKTVDDFIGNRALRVAHEMVLDDKRDLVPPILHFSKPAVGTVRFNGLCVLDSLVLTWFEDHGRPVRNYRAHLTVLDEEFVDVEWLHRRASARSTTELLGDGPEAWRRCQLGFVDRLQIWAPSIRDKAGQLPPPDSKESEVLHRLADMTPIEFEAAVVSLFRELEEVRHNITRTRPTADGGFDFFGTFMFPPPLRYEIEFLGEAKKFHRERSRVTATRLPSRRPAGQRTVRSIRDDLVLHSAGAGGGPCGPLSHDPHSRRGRRSHDAGTQNRPIRRDLSELARGGR